MRGRLPKAFTYTGTGAALDVEIGFRPVAILFYNETDGDVVGFAIDGQDDAKGLKIVDSGADTTNLSFASADGITFTSRGFSVGTDSALNEDEKVYRGVAF